jgi:hypothetical protein
MYRQGLGDCFLLTFPRKPKPFHMLLDCGALNSKHYGSELIKDVVNDIKTETEGRLDVVAATHEHWDHISGFYQAQDVFKEIDVERVWVAWTEEPDNEAAQLLKKKFKKQKKAVEKALAKLPNNEKDRHLSLYKKAITELFGFFGGVGTTGGKSYVDQAWDNLLSLGKKVYCDPKKRPLEMDGVDGVRVYILGPPEDPEFIKKRLSTKETYDEGKHAFSLLDSFLAAVASDENAPEETARAFPFDQRFRIPPNEAKRARFFQDNYGFTKGTKTGWRRIDHAWLNLAGELALHLDNYTNNSCLAMAIELVDSGKVLLFPGDAQVGNWLSWGELSWKIKDAQGKTQTVTSADLLSRTVLYKVGHHGSHNATLRAKGLELMESPDLVAMIPVHRKTAKDQEWEFPYSRLWDRLKVKARGRVLLADAKHIKEIEHEAQDMLSPAEWKSFQDSTKFTPLFIEHRVKY